MPNRRPHSGELVLLAASGLAVVLGSIHAFSVLLVPLEAQFGASRAMVSATHSLSLGALTLAVLFGHHLFARWSAGSLVLGVGFVSATGAGIAAMAGSLPVVWLGFGLLFGATNGLGYGFGLQIAAQTYRGREGMAMGIVTAAYAFGATVAPFLMARTLPQGGFPLVMAGLAAALLLVAIVATLMLRRSQVVFQPADATPASRVTSRDTPLLWLAYGAGASAGLMTMGHAAGIVQSGHPDGATWIAPAVIAAFNLAGSLCGGRLADRMSSRRLLAALPVVALVSAGSLATSPSPVVMLAGFAGTGFGYGGLIAAYPAVIAKQFGAGHSARIYGRVFTAWGCAGLLAPWLAGRLFDTTGSYQTALWTTAALAGLSSCAATSFFLLNRSVRPQG